MAFSPEEIENKEFLPALRGYDKEEVRAFLIAVASDYRSALSAPRPSVEPSSAGSYEALGKEVADILRTSKESAEKIVRDARQEAGAEKSRADQEASHIRDAARDAADKVKADSQRYAAEVKAAADRQAAEAIQKARRRVETLRSAETKIRDRLYSMEAVIGSLRDVLDEEGGLSRGPSAAADDLDEDKPVGTDLAEGHGDELAEDSDQDDLPEMKSDSSVG